MNKFAPYIGAGISNLFILSQNNDYHLQDFKYYYGLQDFKSYVGNVLPFYHLGLMGTVGLKYKLKNNHFINLEFNYQNFSNLNMNQTLRMNTIYYSAQLGYLF
jgi:outer membrane protein W